MSVGNFPKQRSVALLLDYGQLEVGGMLVFDARPIGSMTLGAIAQEQLLPSGGGLRFRKQRVGLGSGRRGCPPIAVWFVSEVLCEGCEERENGNT
jgi:hypothetical protein